MARRSSFEVVAEIPHPNARKPFYDLLAAGWGISRQEPVSALESVGIGFLWRSRAPQHRYSRLPRPWAVIRDGLEARGILSPKAYVYILPSEVQRISGDEQPVLVVNVERT